VAPVIPAPLFFVRLKSRIQDRPVDTAGLVRYSLVL